MNLSPASVAVVIPCYRVARQILDVISRIGPEVALIFVIDDACPERSGDLVESKCMDERVRVIRHAANQGVGGAVCSGYQAALSSCMTVVVKLDGDGQMDPTLIPALCRPLLSGQADYAKGNRFHRIADVKKMPSLRLFGNAILSFLSKISTGYWQLFDPTNGFTAIHSSVLAELPLDRVSRRYFFESDLLFHLNQTRAMVVELPMQAVYANETSSLNPLAQLFPFISGNAKNFIRRIGYSYFIRGFSLASIELLLAIPLLGFGLGFGIWQWIRSSSSGDISTAGTVMLAALPIILGVQLLLSWLNFDIATEPRQPIHPRLMAHN